MKLKYFVIGLCVVFGLLIIRAALPWYDTDDTYQVVVDQHSNEEFLKNDFDNKIPCISEVDGVGVKAVPFGVILESCHASWFVFLNLFLFQIKGDANLF
ncbi:MAG: hypothetical protein UX09_C0034G0014 [Candidatus Uhrbacteria bacterium GW2011_GWE2_45_35]|uniref:Uncharacterized protein n=2 Tax=Candidatus Uhriibacteriota TaxID=1752732 RepID=A0A0G1JG29_9BACT|nr:MAG: hypothetical protein UW63_C0030G0008 [Candidatus Uhrbacteria bacterium GW2011_GWF2_44_350]KKU07149.1 MAG: hypothetical protein UX09_C0034G0014 [Candidatus Uhrbacteria bacterium GW2011_GWE2_45_35]